MRKPRCSSLNCPRFWERLWIQFDEQLWVIDGGTACRCSKQLSSKRTPNTSSSNNHSIHYNFLLVRWSRQYISGTTVSPNCRPNSPETVVGSRSWASETGHCPVYPTVVNPSATGPNTAGPTTAVHYKPSVSNTTVLKATGRLITPL